MSPATYQLSSDEQRAAKAQALADSRMRRLLQVRAEDRRLARARAGRFRAVCDQSSQLLKEEITGILEQQRQLEVAALRAQYAAALAGIQQGQRDAQQHAQAAARAEQEKRVLLAQREAEAQERFARALAKVQGAKRAELESFLQQVGALAWARIRRRPPFPMHAVSCCSPPQPRGAARHTVCCTMHRRRAVGAAAQLPPSFRRHAACRCSSACGARS
jgi:hypothetical protein